MQTPQSPLTEQIDWYLASLRARAASPATIHTYRSVLTRLARYAASRGIERAQDLTADLVRDAAIEALDQGARAIGNGATTTKGNEGIARLLVSAARSMAAELRARQGLPMPDLSTVPIARMPERIQPRVDLDDFARMEQALARRAAYARFPRFVLARDAALVQFLFESALRAIEVCRLNVQDLDLERGTVTVYCGKGRKPRRLSIADPDEPDDGGETVRRLRAYLAQRAKRATRTHALWIGTRGARLSPGALRTLLGTLCQEADLSARPPHAFRRGWFTVAYQSTPSDLPVLAARMGWSDRSTNMVAVYTRGARLDFAALPRPLVTRACLLRSARDR